MKSPTVYATHNALKPTDEVPGSPYEYVFRLAHEIELQTHESELKAAGELLRRTRTISEVRDHQLDYLEQDVRRLLATLRSIQAETGQEDSEKAVRHIYEIAGRTLARYRMEYPE